MLDGKVMPTKLLVLCFKMATKPCTKYVIAGDYGASHKWDKNESESLQDIVF